MHDYLLICYSPEKIRAFILSFTEWGLSTAASSASSNRGPGHIDLTSAPLVCAPLLPRAPKSTESAPFDFGAEPPFTLKDIRNAIPAKCFKKNTFRSLSYLARDVVIVAGLAAGALAIKTPWLWPAYWAAQGTMFWALFVIGHDCGHGSFSNNSLLNSIVGKSFVASFTWVRLCKRPRGLESWSRCTATLLIGIRLEGVCEILFILDVAILLFQPPPLLLLVLLSLGHLTHSFIMVPYHGWRISHRTHHANHGHIENDESW